MQWGGVKRSNTVRFLQENGDLRWRAIECVLVFLQKAMVQYTILKYL